MQTVGRYQILKPLGQGGMGKVFLAGDPLLGRQVAIKVISDLEAEDGATADWLRTRFLQEARAIALLSHPHIVTIHDIGEHLGDTYIVMEYVLGQSLSARRARPIERRELVRIVKETAAGLDYAHGKNVIHRDIKPANLLLDASGSVKIADFGLAKLATSTQSTGSGKVAGTLQYMSPEQLQNHKVVGSSDQYSLAAMAYEILTGHAVFEAESIGALAYQICSQAPRPPRLLAPDLPDATNRVFERALAKVPTDRFPTCGTFAAALAASLSGEKETETFTQTIGIPAGPLRRPRQPVPRASRSPWRRGLMIGGVAALLTCGMAAFIQLRGHFGLTGEKRVQPTMPPRPNPPAAEAAPQTQQPAEHKPPPSVAAPKPKPAVTPLPPPPTPAVPAEGRLVWTGDLDPGQEIDLGASTAGSVTGALPGVPVNVDLHPSSVHVVTPPGPDNQWRHLVVRNDGLKQTVIVVKWSVRK
jgi:serine/threonine protein kinase